MRHACIAILAALAILGCSPEPERHWYDIDMNPPIYWVEPITDLECACASTVTPMPGAFLVPLLDLETREISFMEATGNYNLDPSDPYRKHPTN